MDQPQPAPYSRQLKVDETTLESLTRARFEIIEKLKETTITDEDIRNLEPHPSDYRLACFASEVYEDDCTIPDDCDWKLLIKTTNKSRGNGYVGAAFFNPLQQQIIIAHRGTNSLNAAWTDLKSIFWGSVSSQISSALTFSDFIRDVIVELQSEKKWRYQLSFTGHSLGGFLAQITTFGVKYLKRYEDVGFFQKSTDAGIHSHCVTFDNPGCAEMLNKITDHCDLRYLKTIFPNALDMTAYLSAPNMVNTCNRHVGVVMRLKLSFQEMSSWSAKTPLYHLETHNMDNIKSVFDSNEEKINVEVEQMFDWPVAYGPSDETRKFFKIGNKKLNFIPDTETSLVSIGEGRFNTIRYLPKRPSIYSYCNVALFSEDELFLLKHWLKIVESSIKIDEKFTPLNLPFKDLFFRFKQIGDDLLFHDKTSMKETIKRCKQIFRWYPEEIKNCLKSVSLKSHDVIMQVGVDSYNQSIKKCEVNFNDSVKLEDFLEAKENILSIKANVENREIEMLRLFNIFKQIRLKQSVKIDKYTEEDRFLFVNRTYLRTLLRYTELDLFINSKLNLLIVDLVNETVDDDVSKLIKGFAKNDRKVVIVTNSKEKTTLDFKFTDLTLDSQKFVLNYEIIKLGNKKFSLATFLKTDDENWADKLTFLNDYEFLDRILNDRCIELKNDSLNLSKLENFYIQADVNQNYSDDEFIKLTRNSDCGLIESKIVITYVCDLPPAIEKLQISCDKLQTADLDEASQYFKERCDEECSWKFYWFHYDENFSLKEIYNPDLYIPRSFNEMILDETKITISIKEELYRQEKKGTNRVTVELTKPDNESLKCNFRVDRKNNKVHYVWDGKDKNSEISDIRSFLTISHDGSLAEQELVDRRIVLITGDPGIGKSTTVTNILSKIERSWIFKLTYDDCTKIVKNLNGTFEVDQISKQLLRIKSNNQSDFLKYHLAHKTPIKVVFLFDEVFDSSYDQNYEDRIIKFLKYLCDETESFVIVTSRETKREMIENVLNICSIHFKQFDRKDVKEYLMNYWSELYHLDIELERLTLEGLDDYTRRLLKKAEEIFDKKILNFIGIPLQIKLLAEVAAPDYASLSKSSLNGIPLELPDSLTGIYEAFVEKKYDIVCNKAGLGDLYSVKKGYLDFIDTKLRFFSASKYGFHDYNFEELEALQQTGLVQGFEFIHQTIEEFYFARQIYVWLKEHNGRWGDKQSKLEDYLIDDVFTKPDFSIIRMFLDTYISKITPEDAPFYSRKIAETLNERLGKKYGVFATMSFDTLIREHCQGTVIFLLESLKNHYTTETFLPLLKRRIIFNKTVLCFACRDNQTLVIDYFVKFLEAQSKETQNEIIMANFDIYQSSSYVDIDGMSNALDNFIARIRTPLKSFNKEIAKIIKEDVVLISDLMNAVKSGSLEDVRKCVTNVSETLKPHLLTVAVDDRDNALHLAVKYGHLEIVRFLINHGWNVSQRDFIGITPIAIACETGNLEILRYLIENGGDYKKGDKNGTTPFLRAAKGGHADVVEYFLKEMKYKNVNEKDLSGSTALHYAVRNKRKRVLEVLLKHDGIDVDTEDRSGWRPLGAAVETENLELIDMLVKAGATIDYENGYGETLIERAIRSNCREDVVSYLIESLSNESKIKKSPIMFRLRRLFRK